jgi:putative ABC transport system ATP-binding protein
MLVGKDLCLRYGTTVALAGASVAVAPGEVIALTGQSGSGKSTLLYCLSGIVRPDSGAVVYQGTDLVQVGDEAKGRIRRSDFGFVFQFAELVPELTIAENVALPLEINGVRPRERRRRVEAILVSLGIDAQAARRPAQVSGGQAQRAAVARALVHRPQVVFADEPTGSLDTANTQLVLDALIAGAREYGGAVVIATHEAHVAESVDREVKVVDGRVDEFVGSRS